MKRLLMLFLCFTMLLSFAACKQEKEPEVPKKPTPAAPEAVSAARERYPNFFDLNPQNGLTVYVCEFAPDSYSYYLLEGTPLDHDTKSVMSSTMHMHAARTDDMKAILGSYDVDVDMILVVPFQHPLSSCIAPIYKYDKDGNLEKDRDDYLMEQRELLGLT